MFQSTRVVAVGGGKGGVGKSVIASNLAVGLAQAGTSTVLLDADLGAPNLHTLLGIERPTGSLGDVLSGSSKRLADVITPSEVPGLSLICGAGPILGVANPEFQKKQRLIREISQLEAEVLVVDLGAGVSFNVVDFFNAADVRIVVVTPQLTSLHNAYGFMKSALHRQLQRSIAGRPGYDDLFGQPGWSEEKIDQLLERVALFDPRYLDVFGPLIESFSIILLGNLLTSPKEAGVLFAMRRMVSDFLHVECQIAGGLLRDPKVETSINRRRPFLLERRLDANDEVLRALVAAIIEKDPEPDRAQRQLALEAATRLPKSRGQVGAQVQRGKERDTWDESRFAQELRGRQRVFPRFDVAFPVVLKIDGASHDAVLADLSRSGARLTGAPEVIEGQRIELRLPRSLDRTAKRWFWAPAVVRRYDVTDHVAGCQFEASDVVQKAIDSLVGQAASSQAQASSGIEDGRAEGGS
jgi:flagellar biosynthesis protein FlhG